MAKLRMSSFMCKAAGAIVVWAIASSGVVACDRGDSHRAILIAPDSSGDYSKVLKDDDAPTSKDDLLSSTPSLAAALKSGKTASYYEAGNSDPGALTFVGGDSASSPLVKKKVSGTSLNSITLGVMTDEQVENSQAYPLGSDDVVLRCGYLPYAPHVAYRLICVWADKESIGLLEYFLNGTTAETAAADQRSTAADAIQFRRDAEKNFPNS